jgi:hypothetical protein
MAGRTRNRTRCPECGRPLSDDARRTCTGCGAPLDRELGVADVIPADRRHVLVPGGDGEDEPYAVIGEKPVPRCPSCDGPFPDGLPACPKCNFDRAARRRVPRVYAPFDRTWEAGLPFLVRFAAFLACQAVNVGITWFVVGFADEVTRAFGGWAVIASLQAFLLGTYDRVRVTRSRKGAVAITKTWRYFFIPLPSRELDWRDADQVGLRHDDVGWLEWLMCLQLLTYGIIPGVLWWWYAIRPARVAAVLTRDGGSVVHSLYTGTDTEKAEEIAEAVRDVTGLAFNPVI